MHSELLLKRSSNNSCLPKCPHLKKSIEQAHLENGPYEQIVSHLEKELELNGLEAPNELQINTVTQQATQQTPQSPNKLAAIAKRQVSTGISADISSEKKTEPGITRIVPTIATIITVTVKHTLTPTKKFPTIPTQTIQIIKTTEDLDLSTHLVRPVVKLTTPQRNVTSEQTQWTDRLLGIDGRKDKTKSNREMLKATQTGMFKLQPKL